MVSKPLLRPSQSVVDEAKQNPNGWVYAIVGDFGDADVPPEYILGAWHVSPNGTLTGEFTPNEKFDALKSEFHTPPEYLIALARTRPLLWTYEIDPPFERAEVVPQNAIFGGWFADSDGNLTGQFLINPSYDPIAAKANEKPKATG